MPQRLGEIETLAGHRAHVGFQFFLARRPAVFARQFHALEVMFDVEIAVVIPPRAGRILHGFLLEAREGQEALLDGRLQFFEIEFVLEHHDADDHHQVGRVLHAEPGGIDTRHPLAVEERNAGNAWQAGHARNIGHSVVCGFRCYWFSLNYSNLACKSITAPRNRRDASIAKIAITPRFRYSHFSLSLMP